MASAWRDVASVLKGRDRPTSQKAIASRLGITESVLSKYLSGALAPEPVLALRLAAACGVPPAEVGDLIGITSPGRPQLADADTPATVLHGVGAPLVAEDVAAGPGSLPSVPDDRVYFFHRSYMAHHGWRESDRDRFCCVRLGRAATASSMVPTIPPKAVLLIDRRYPEEKLRRLQRGICLVETDEGLAVKRATVTDGVLMLESDNPEPQYHARAIQLAGVQIRDVIRGKVLSWTVEASTRE